MKVQGPGRIQSQKNIRKSERPSGSGAAFRGQVEAGGTGGSANVSGSSPLASVDALLSLQEVQGPGTDAESQARHGHQMLDILEDVRRDLLLGVVPKARLAQLARMAGAGRTDYTDPRLGEILSEIELRARVELAKLEAA